MWLDISYIVKLYIVKNLFEIMCIFVEYLLFVMLVSKDCNPLVVYIPIILLILQTKFGHANFKHLHIYEIHTMSYVSRAYHTSVKVTFNPQP